MKQCTYCGAAYPDEETECAIDRSPLILAAVHSLAEAASEQKADPAPLSNGIGEVVRPPLTDRKLRVFELILVCVIAFGPSLFYEAEIFFQEPGRIGRSQNWVYAGFHEIAGLALLWYVQLRRSKAVAALGMAWDKRDLGRSIFLFIFGNIAFVVTYSVLYLTGLTPVASGAATRHVAHFLFRGGITSVTFLFQFINPFFEELIVRAYVITEVRGLTGSAAKAVIASTLFQCSYHLYQGGALTVATGAMFLLFSVYYAKTNRIIPVILAHLYCDVSGTLVALLRGA